MTEPAGEEPVTCACGRELTDPVSVSRGAGPVCWRKLHGRTTRQPRRTAPPAAAPRPGPRQPELPYDDQLELDWSTS
jgi:hypothetical protein